MGYNPTVTNAEVAARSSRSASASPPDEQKRLVDLDYGYMAKNDAAFKEWWDKSFKG